MLQCHSIGRAILFLCFLCVYVKLIWVNSPNMLVSAILTSLMFTLHSAIMRQLAVNFKVPEINIEEWESLSYFTGLYGQQGMFSFIIS